uniref:ABC transmembrane type-1 domain-containing protein n=1 Tax=Saimiri boliviensis boliviensis TaxID=39432 RepID=A0A2K6RZ91_SAIBB
QSPEKSASFFSKVTYSWFSRVITLGYKRPLEREDLFELNETDSSYTVCPIFEKQWRKEVLRTKERQKAKASFHKEADDTKPSLLYALWNTFKSVLIQVALFKVFADILSFTSPLIMKQMIIFCEQSSDFGWNGYGYAMALFVVVFSQTLILQQYQRFNMLTSAKVKTAVNGLIYKKALLLSNVSRQKCSATHGHDIKPQSPLVCSFSNSDGHFSPLARAGSSSVSSGGSPCICYTNKCFSYN